eukprot:SAG11_NODE_5131_length_1656_cov_1.095697_2_plen_258_part_00
MSLAVAMLVLVLLLDPGGHCQDSRILGQSMRTAFTAVTSCRCSWPHSAVMFANSARVTISERLQAGRPEMSPATAVLETVSAHRSSSTSAGIMGSSGSGGDVANKAVQSSGGAGAGAAASGGAVSEEVRSSGGIAEVAAARAARVAAHETVHPGPKTKGEGKDPKEGAEDVGMPAGLEERLAMASAHRQRGDESSLVAAEQHFLAALKLAPKVRAAEIQRDVSATAPMPSLSHCFVCHGRERDSADAFAFSLLCLSR